MDRGLVGSLRLAAAYVLEGRVTVEGAVIDKPGCLVPAEAHLALDLPAYSYVSRAGHKLQGALEAFRIDARSMTAMDVGASTGGFTDCLLQHGVQRVYAIDVGRGLLDYTLRRDERVVLMEGTNFRYFEPGGLLSAIDIATVDVSFISLELMLPKIMPCLRQSGILLALIKPQFELDKKEVGRGGVVRSPGMHAKAVDKVRRAAEGLGLAVIGVLPSPVKGSKGNQEFFIYLRKP